MTTEVPDKLTIIAGKGAYPRLLAESAHLQGVRHVAAVAFRGETDKHLKAVCDELHWVYIGQLGRLLDAIAATGARHAVMAGQITPTHLFRVRMDGRMMALLRSLPERNAETIFGAIGNELRAIGVELLPASSFMEAHMPRAGSLTQRAPTDDERRDIALGFTVAKASSGLDIGQNVVLKRGTILAVEAFEGTDAAIKRAGKLGGPGAVVVKVAKQGHDMRFDIPVIGLNTVKSLHQARCAAMAVEAGKAILLEREAVIARMDALRICLVAAAPTATGQEPS
jgi:UDP-2,3-diacylglucosamine hydrolase